MLARRQTIVPLSELNGELRQSPALHHLVSSGVLEEARELGRDGAIRYRFGHTLFFDYALATHVLADAGYRRAILSDKAGLTLIAPSIEMFFDMRWDGDDPARERYWDDILELTGDPKTSAIVVSLAVSTAARKAQSRQDLSPLATALSSPARRLAAVRAVEALVRSLESNNVDVTANGGHPWASLLAALSDALEDTADSGAAATTFRLERQLLSRRNTLDAEAYAATARAARTLLHGLLRE